MEELLKFLNSIYPLSDKLIEHLGSVNKYKEYKKKDFLLKAGHICKNIYFVERGLLRGYYLKNDKEVSSWFIKEGELCISIKSFYNQTAGIENIHALEDTGVFYISHRELENIYHNYIEFNFVGRELTRKYHELWDDRLFGITMQSALERYEWLLSNHRDLALRVPAKFIASWLDITEVTFSKMKAKLMANGF